MFEGMEQVAIAHDHQFGLEIEVVEAAGSYFGKTVQDSVVAVPKDSALPTSPRLLAGTRGSLARRPPEPSRVHATCLEPVFRIDRPAQLPDLEMQVRSGRVAG